MANSASCSDSLLLSLSSRCGIPIPNVRSSNSTFSKRLCMSDIMSDKEKNTESLVDPLLPVVESFCTAPFQPESRRETDSESEGLLVRAHWGTPEACVPCYAGSDSAVASPRPPSSFLLGHHLEYLQLNAVLHPIRLSVQNRGAFSRIPCVYMQAVRGHHTLQSPPVVEQSIITFQMQRDITLKVPGWAALSKRADRATLGSLRASNPSS